MDLRLQNKVIIITGHAKSNAENLIRILSDEGAILVIIGRKDLEELKQGNSDRNIFWIETDLSNPEECKNAVRAVIKKYSRVDGLINDPGAGSGNAETFLISVQKNLVNYYLMTHFVLPYLKTSKGVIVNISFDTTGTDYGNSAILAASEGGINALTREWSVELLKYGIRVNAVISKESAEQIAGVVAFLLSGKSSHTTGQLIRVSD
jgi:L-fucose dehydrogenase